MKTPDIAIPLLPSRSMADTLRFYQKLGFDGEIVSPNGDYAIVERGSLELHFFLHTALNPAESAFGCYCRVQDVDSVYAAFCQAHLPHHGIPRITVLENKPWGMREFAVIDEDGSLLRIGQVL